MDTQRTPKAHWITPRHSSARQARKEASMSHEKPGSLRYRRLIAAMFEGLAFMAISVGVIWLVTAPKDSLPGGLQLLPRQLTSLAAVALLGLAFILSGYISRRYLSRLDQPRDLAAEQWEHEGLASVAKIKRLEAPLSTIAEDDLVELLPSEDLPIDVDEFGIVASMIEQVHKCKDDGLAVAETKSNIKAVIE